MELAYRWRGHQPGCLTMAAISAVFTIGHVAKMFGEDENWLHEISVPMDLEQGCLWVFGVGEQSVPAFTEYGIECLKQIIIEERALAAARNADGAA